MAKDYALYSNFDAWSHDWAMGGPSWDTFERFPDNPVYRGRIGMEWPVNGFLYLDPVSKNWYLYIGEYRTHYGPAIDTASRRSNCTILRSSDKGKSWEKIGDLFPKNMIVYDSLKIYSPGVMVTYAGGKYHMVFGWGQANVNWRDSKALTGIGYAEADKPEGPWTVSDTPLKVNTQYASKPLLNRYWRMYAPMIVKRENDWVLLYDMDTAPHGRSWALAASTSARPEGPYDSTKILRHVEAKTYYPPYIEHYPAFIHNDYVYFPGTSLISHDYEYVSRVKINDVMDPDKYKVFAAGGIWHSVNIENEYHGIWGQTFTGFIDNDTLYVMFPSHDKENYGTINLAKVPWKHLYRERGFNFSATDRKTFSFIKKGMEVKSFDIAFKLDGTMHLIWDLHGAIDIYTGLGVFSDGNKFSLDQNNAVYKEIVINKASWKIGLHDNNRGYQIIDSGSISHWNNTTNQLKLKKDNGKYSLVINGFKCWEGQLKNESGLAGIALDRHSYLYADRFIVSGEKVPGYITYGFYRPLIAAGNQDSVWNFKKDSLFLYGKGAVSKDDSNFVKWNFYGKGFSLYSPKGPLFGTVNIYLDGKLLKKVSLKNAKPMKSTIVFQSDYISPGKHAVYVESFDGLLPVDCIRVKL